MAFFRPTSSPAQTALYYITGGTLTVVWTVVWYIYLHNNPPAGDGVYYWVAGFLVTGLTLVAIGLGIGRIGQAARNAEAAPPAVVAPAVPVAAAPAAPVAANGTAPVQAVPAAPVAANGTAVAPVQTTPVGR